MGGEGSSRWSWHSKATCVEECRIIDTATFDQPGLLTSALSAGTLTLGRGVEADFVIAPNGPDDLLLVLQHDVTTGLGGTAIHELDRVRSSYFLLIVRTNSQLKPPADVGEESHRFAAIPASIVVPDDTSVRVAGGHH